MGFGSFPADRSLQSVRSEICKSSASPSAESNKQSFGVGKVFIGLEFKKATDDPRGSVCGLVASTIIVAERTDRTSPGQKNAAEVHVIARKPQNTDFLCPVSSWELDSIIRPSLRHCDGQSQDFEFE